MKLKYLTENQTKKILAAYKKHALVKIRLSYEQISGKGKHKILLSESQIKKLDKIKKKKQKKWLELELGYEQMKINHSGGFLPIIFATLGALGGLAGGAAAIANAVNNSKHQTAEEE